MGILRAEEHMSFNRTFNVENNILEFFIAPGYEEYFVPLLHYLKDTGHLMWLEKKENRLMGNGTVD